MTTRFPARAGACTLVALLLAAPVPVAAQGSIGIRTVWIPMPDGVRLAADLYMPAERGEGDAHPVLLEYLPYRKDESRPRNYALYSYFVRQGYVVARVDIRGTGNSEGRLIPYEYSEQELDDGEAVIAWLAEQPWSTGKVGMFGISWGGFNSIQMAVRNPPALKAFVAVCATEDLYQDDVHYMDGVMHVDTWVMAQDLWNALPGAPQFEIDEDYFRNRFDTEPAMFTYMRQQRDGPFWDRASSRDKYDRVRIPGMHIGGWYDGYRDSVPRMLENVEAPVKAIVGPWDHFFPHDAWPGDSIEWRFEAVRWFDHWLRGEDTGIVDEPDFAVFVRDYHPPGPTLDAVPGRWRWEEGWPIERIEHRILHARDDHTLGDAPLAPLIHRLRYKASSGVEAGGPVLWWGSVAHDQRPTDAFSLVYDTPPLAEDTEILGFPRALLEVSADAPHANWYVRLSDVAPDGRVTQVAGAGFNGTHRNSAREPESLVPGEGFPLDIEMHFTSWVFPRGHRIRLAVSNAQWPMMWPTPHRMTTTLEIGGERGARLELPVVPPAERPAPAFREPAPDPSLPGYQTLDAGNVTGYGEISTVTRNLQTGDALAVITNTGGSRYPWGTDLYEERIEHRTSDRHPEDTSALGTYAVEVDLPDRTLRLEAEAGFRSDLDHFYLDYTRRLLVNGERVRERTWSEAIARDHQ